MKLGLVLDADDAVITARARAIWDLMAKFKDVVINHALRGMSTPFIFSGDTYWKRVVARVCVCGW